MFEQIRRSLEELLQRATRPEERREVVSRMKDTLVQATLGIEDLRNALTMSRRKLEVEQKELATVRRRKELAAGRQDAETIAVAERFEKQHSERAAVLEEKVLAMTHELELGERELAEMKAELRTAMSGSPGLGRSPSADAEQEVEDLLANKKDQAVSEEIDSLARARSRAERDAEADRRLEELKKKMGQ